jgi:L-2-hydroxyglutarate oxidase
VRISTRQTDQLITAAAEMSPQLKAVVTALRAQHRASQHGVELTDSELDVLQEALKAVLRADRLVNCAGLHADRIARLADLRPPVQIVPFRGEYYQL